VLLQNGNINPSIPIAHSVNMKENYENMDMLLRDVRYLKYGWKICEDITVIRLLPGMKSGHTTLWCFPCEWDSRAKEKHYKIIYKIKLSSKGKVCQKSTAS